MAGAVFFSSLSTETNSFSNIPTSYASFEAEGIKRGVDVIYEDGDVRPQLKHIADFASKRGFELKGGIAASAEPSAPVQQADYERLRDELLGALSDTDDVRAVLLNLHGAMAATACEDCEGDLLKRIRQIVGADIPVGALLDPHAHLTSDMVENANILIFMKEYPHIDGEARMKELLDLIGKLLDGAIKPTPAVADCQLLGFFPTDRGPMRLFVDELFKVEKTPGVLSISFVHGFPWGDTAETGAKLLVYTDGDEALAETTTEALKRRLWAIAHQVTPELTALEDAIARCAADRDRPLILADIADNPGGGAPSDSTFVLRALLEAGVQDAAQGLLYDPMAVRMCHEVGAGGRLDFRLGGKTSRFSGAPLDIEADVIDVRKGARMQVVDGVSFPMGDTAWIRTAGIDIVLSSERIQMYAPDGFLHIGLNPAAKKVLVVKSSNHFRAFFGHLTDDIIDVATPGAIQFNFSDLPYKNLKKPRHPRDFISGLTDLKTSKAVEATAPS